MIVRHIRLRIEFMVCESLCKESCMLCALSVEHIRTSLTLRWLFVFLILEITWNAVISAEVSVLFILNTSSIKIFLFVSFFYLNVRLNILKSVKFPKSHLLQKKSVINNSVTGFNSVAKRLRNGGPTTQRDLKQRRNH